MKQLVAAAFLSLVVGGAAQAQELICLTPFDWCEPDYSLYPGAVCGCAGDRGVVVTVESSGYLADELPGEVCYTNFDPCLVEGALIGDECECAAIPGIVGSYQ